MNLLAYHKQDYFVEYRFKKRIYDFLSTYLHALLLILHLLYFQCNKLVYVSIVLHNNS